MCFNVYGAECYTKLNELWVTSNDMESYTIQTFTNCCADY